MITDRITQINKTKEELLEILTKNNIQIKYSAKPKKKLIEILPAHHNYHIQFGFDKDLVLPSSCHSNLRAF